MIIELIAITPDCEKVIEEAGRTCYKSPVGNPEIIRNWIKRGHESTIEHASATFRISEVSRSLTHQLVRHRLASYSQQSQRYVNENEFSYVIPDSIRENPEALNLFLSTIHILHNAYSELLAMGIKKEDARFLLPNACHTEIVMTMNFREFRHFIKLRADKHAQWEIRELAYGILDILREYAPNVFFDFED